MRKLFLLLVLSGFFMSCMAVQDSIPQKRIYNASEVTVPPEIDGWLTDESWTAAEWSGDFVMYEPYDDRSPSQDTKFKLIFDSNNIYVAIRAFDTDPDSIVKRLTRRDDIDGDLVAFQFDSYHDLQTAFTFFASVAGSKMDNFSSGDGNYEDETWDPIWWVETQIDDQGWTMEAKIPFSQLRFDKNSDGVWGFQVARMVFRKNETSLWQPMKRDAPGWIHLIGELHGLDNINPRKQADLTPYAVAGIETFEKEEDDPFRSTGRKYLYNAGLDAKVGVTNNFTLDLTINPDFGQVEADPSEVNLTAFETFFQEKRPFFIEGKNIFDFSLGVSGMDNLFYSRRIGRRPQYFPELEDNEYEDSPTFTNILGAAKLTGKTRNGLSVGIMESVTSKEQAEIDRDGERRSETVEPFTNYFATRIIKDHNKGNTIFGGMFTATNRFTDEPHLDYLHKGAYTGGLNFQQYFADRSYSFNISGSASHVAGSPEAIFNTQEAPGRYYQRPDADYVEIDSSRTSLTGFSTSVDFGKASGNFNYRLFLTMKSPGLELNDIGYMMYSDEILQIFWMGYRFTKPFSIFRSANINLNQWNAWDFGGRHQVLGANINGHAEFKNFWGAAFFLSYDSESHINSALRGGPTLTLPPEYNVSLYAATNSRKKLIAEIEFDYSRKSENSGMRMGSSFELTYKPISNLQLSVEPGFSKRFNELQYVTQDDIENTKRYIFASLNQQIINMSVRIDVILTPELTIQYWGQPFMARGEYTEFKYITNSKASEYHDRFRIYDPAEIYYSTEDEMYYVNEQQSGLSYGFENPDFNVKEFLSNLVFRWEYRPASYLYLVWSQSRECYEINGNTGFRDDFIDMWQVRPRNVFLVKFSYRIGR